jgi:hypothetical protein
LKEENAFECGSAPDQDRDGCRNQVDAGIALEWEAKVLDTANASRVEDAFAGVLKKASCRSNGRRATV